MGESMSMKGKKWKEGQICQFHGMSYLGQNRLWLPKVIKSINFFVFLWLNYKVTLISWDKCYLRELILTVSLYLND